MGKEEHLRVKECKGTDKMKQRYKQEYKQDDIKIASEEKGRRRR